MTDEYKEIISRLQNLERHLINFILPIQDICKIFKDASRLDTLINILQKPLRVDDRDFRDRVTQMTSMTERFSVEMKNLDVKQTMDEIRYIGKRLNEIQSKLESFEKKGIDQNIKLDFTLDGYTMVKKPIGYDGSDPVEDPNEHLIRLLDSIPERQRKVLIHRLGLFGEDKKTFIQIGIIFGVGAARISQIFRNALRRLRHRLNKPLVSKITHTELKDLINKS